MVNEKNIPFSEKDLSKIGNDRSKKNKKNIFLFSENSFEAKRIYITLLYAMHVDKK